VALVLGVLGQAVAGAYLHGSAVLGGLRPRSDLDVLVVSSRSTTEDERRRILAGLLARSREPRPLELTIVAAPEIDPWRYPPSFDFQFGEWLRASFERGQTPWTRRVSPDLATLLTVVIREGRRLVGPPAAELLPAVPRGDLDSAMLDSVAPLLLDLEDDTTNVLLTLARIWSTLADGTIRSKDTAADWALALLPPEHRPVLEHARAVYLGEAEECWDDLDGRVGPHADHVVGGIERAAG
jgi:predicted nucleotidyltransferase